MHIIDHQLVYIYLKFAFEELLFHKPGEGIMLSLLATLLSPLRWVISKFVESYIKKITPIRKYGLIPYHSFFHAMSSVLFAVLPENFYERVKNESIILRIPKSIEFYKHGITLEGHSVPIKADLVIFGTGFKGDEKLRSIFKSHSLHSIVTGSLENIVPLYKYNYLYIHDRECIHPRIPQMVVIGYSESASNLYTSEMKAMCLSHFLEGGFQLPSIKLMEKDVKEWDKYMKEYNPEHYRRSSIAANQICTNDQLCKDMGYNPKRKKGFISELFMPYGPNDYIGLRLSGLPKIPSFYENKCPEAFNGKVIHSMDIARMGSSVATKFVQGKHIIVIDFLKWALDVAAECAETNAKRRNRVSLLATLLSPLVKAFSTYFNSCKLHRYNIISNFVESYIKKTTPIKKYGIVPNCNFFQAMSSSLFSLLPENFYEKAKNENVLLKNSKSFEFYKDGIILEGESVPIKADLVIFSTGFKGDEKLQNIFQSASLQKILTSSLENIVPLYRECINPRIPQLAIIGYSESSSNLYTSEIRVMWLAHLLESGFKLRSIKLMEEDVKKWDKYMKEDNHEYYRRSSIRIIHIWHNDQLCRVWVIILREKK
ncbi:hypothetical protein IEQ34_007791 [Dendrobium chrysotoxum]|uniref:Flavin-containing monooxygenase n=1 Tax=Dendrobium chrysotoxum TaxID=161865 RepID=A0AAV7H543_DENCH|nr:hypothetical protein IEQ34_007791 [Dendrobium chrysotoxum]